MLLVFGESKIICGLSTYGGSVAPVLFRVNCIYLTIDLMIHLKRNLPKHIITQKRKFLKETCKGRFWQCEIL